MRRVEHPGSHPPIGLERPADRQVHAAFEQHFRISELADLWRVGRETVRKLVKDEPGVIKATGAPVRSITRIVSV